MGFLFWMVRPIGQSTSGIWRRATSIIHQLRSVEFRCPRKAALLSGSLLRWLVRTGQNCFITRSITKWSATLRRDTAPRYPSASWGGAESFAWLWQRVPRLQRSASHRSGPGASWSPQATPVPQPSIPLSCLPQVDEGGRAPLSLHHFFATDDHDNLHGDAVIKLSALPKYGCIENTGTGNRSGFAGELLKVWKQGVGDILIKPGHGELKWEGPISRKWKKRIFFIKKRKKLLSIFFILCICTSKIY